jgi:hypothetical protein
MKKDLLISFFLFMTCALGMAQTVVYSDDFDSYTAGSYMAQSNSAWTTWSNAPGTAEDGVITNSLSSSSPNSLYISGSTDQMYTFANYNTGHYTLAFNMYVPSTGNGAYFNIQHAIGQIWALGCYFDNDGTGYLTVGDVRYDFTYPSNAWFSVLLDMNMDQDEASLSINNIEVNSWPFHYSENSTGGSIVLAAINFYAGTPYDNLEGTYYVDDFVVTEVTAALVGHFVVSPDSLQATMVPNDSCTLNLICNNPGTDYIHYRIVPSYDISNPDMTSTGGTVLRYCHDTILTRWGYIGGAQYDIAIGFPSDSIQSHIGKTLQSVSVMLTDGLNGAKIRVYGMSYYGPGEVLYEQSFVPVNGWNNVTLTTPFVIDGSDLWVGVWIDQPDSVWPVICDAYANNEYSDWFTGANNSNWYSYSTMYPHNHMIVAYIDGTPINPWIKVSPSEGSLFPPDYTPWLTDEDSVTVAVTLNSFGMGGGENHTAKLHCYSTAYDNPEEVVPVCLQTTGVSVNEYNEIEVVLYPNPATNFLQINSEQILRVEVYNLTGQKVFDNTYNDSHVVIPTEGMALSTYIVRVTTTGGQTTKKVVVR